METQVSSVVCNDARTLVDIPRSVGERSPDKTYIRYLGEEVTFKKMRMEAERTAAYLLDRGIKVGTRITVVLDNRPEFIYSFFGVMIAGGIVVTVSPKSTPGRIQEIVEDSDSEYFISEDDYYDSISDTLKSIDPGLERKLIKLSEIAAYNYDSSSAIPYHKPEEEDIAFFQYTSATTGRSKGVQISHRAVMENIRGMAAHVSSTSDDLFSSFMPLYHDMGLVSLGLLPAYVGATLLLYKQDIRNIYSWLGDMAEFKPTLTGCSNTILYLTRRVVRDPSQYDLTSLRAVFVGSEQVYYNTVKDFENDYNIPNVVVPAYGLAEATLAVTMTPMNRGIIADKSNIVSCGKPLKDVKIKIEKRGNSQEGEVLIHSPALMSGYHKRPEETEKVFTEDGFLRTGDLGYLDEDNELFILGRIKNIIIRGGENLSPGDLEEVALRSSEIRTAGVTSVKNSESENKEDIVLVAELNQARILKDESKINEINKFIVAESKRDCAYQADRIYYVPPGSIPFSPNGKMQHLKMKESMESGEFFNRDYQERSGVS